MDDIKESYKKNRNALFIYFILIVMILTYYLIWSRIGNIYYSYIFEKNDKINISFSNIKKRGFPFYINFDLQNVQVKNNYKQDILFNTKELRLSSLIFTKKIKLITEKIDVESNSRIQNITLTKEKGDNIIIGFEKNKLSYLDINVKGINVIDNNSENNNRSEFNIENFKFKYDIKSNEFNKNVISLFDFSKLSYQQLDKEKVFKKEFSGKSSITAHNDVYNDVNITTKISIDDLVFFNITDNYYFKLNGLSEANAQTSETNIDLMIKIFNKEKMFKTLASDGESNELFSFIASLLNEVKPNEKNTENEMYIHFSKPKDSNNYLINGELLDDFITRITPIIQQNSLQKLNNLNE